MNGYFQLINEDSGTSVKLIPPTQGGEPIELSEVTNYLTVKNVAYDLKTLHRELAKLREEPIIVKLQPERAFAQREYFDLFASQDRMEASIRFIAPSNDGEVMDKQEILKDLNFKKIVYGVDEKVIDQFVAERRYCENIVVARGSVPKQGTDARIEYYFNMDVKARPTLKEDGSVDFFHLNTLNHCEAGDVLARLFPEQEGEAGSSVFGEAVRPREVKHQRLEYGRNITLSEDRTELISDVNGHVMLIEGKVFVSDLLEVENVDNSTGNIEYEGSVQVNGNVCSNFTIRAKGNIEVRGVVEGAVIEAGGDIIIARGVNGMSKGKLTAGGNIIAKFIENAEVTARGYVESGSILHSVVMAGTEVNVNGKRGFITGGRVCATNKVCVKTLGSAMGADTMIDIGIDPEIKKRYSELQKQIVEDDKAVRTMQPVILAATQKLAKGIKLPPEQLTYIKALNQANMQKQEELKRCTEELNDLQERMEAGHNGQVIVTGEVFPGTRISISDASVVIRSNLKYCRFVKERGDVKMTAI